MSNFFTHMTSFFTDIPLHVVTETLLIIKERKPAHQRLLIEQLFMRDPVLFRVSQSKIPLFTKFCREHADLGPEEVHALIQLRWTLPAPAKRLKTTPQPSKEEGHFRLVRSFIA